MRDSRPDRLRREGPPGGGPRSLPPMHALLDAPELRPWVERHGRDRVRGVAARQLDGWRKRLAKSGAAASIEDVLASVLAGLEEETRLQLRRVVNATGVVLHTGLGRAPLAEEAVQAIAAVATGYCNLELDMETGERGQRSTSVGALLRELAGAEAGLVVNNNAGAVLLALSALAAGREVVVSRGELVEIGGGFRVPEVMAQSGARLREVGTTNRTHLRDYEQALGPETALLLRVHQSNFRIVGFSTAPALEDLAGLAHARGVPLLCDLGSGHLDTTDGSVPAALGEPGVREALDAGADLVTFSGDKLLGGPQAGVVCGRAPLVAACATHPLQRALRVDKLTLAALQATLDLYARGVAAERVPALRMLRTPQGELAARAERLAAAVAEAVGDLGLVEVCAEESQAGGGALAARGLPTAVVAVAPRALGVPEVQAALRRGRPPVLARARDGRVLLDTRTLSAEDAGTLPALIRAALGGTPAE